LEVQLITKKGFGRIVVGSKVHTYTNKISVYDENLHV
jgi:hypothetical protein